MLEEAVQAAARATIPEQAEQADALATIPEQAERHQRLTTAFAAGALGWAENP